MSKSPSNRQNTQSERRSRSKSPSRPKPAKVKLVKQGKQGNECRLVPEHDKDVLGIYVTDSKSGAAPGMDEIAIRIYLYGADDRQAAEVNDVLAELFGNANIHKVEYPFSQSEFMESILYDAFEQAPGVGIPGNKPLSHVFKITGQYGTPQYHKITSNHDENSLILTQMEFKIGHAVQEKTNNAIVMFQDMFKDLGAYSTNYMFIGLQTP